VDGGRIAGIQLALIVPGKREKRREGAERRGRRRRGMREGEEERRGRREREVKEEENRRRRLNEYVTDINETKTK
jgi:hypothetical protein